MSGPWVALAFIYCVYALCAHVACIGLTCIGNVGYPQRHPLTTGARSSVSSRSSTSAMTAPRRGGSTSPRLAGRASELLACKSCSTLQDGHRCHRWMACSVIATRRLFHQRRPGACSFVSWTILCCRRLWWRWLRTPRDIVPLALRRAVQNCGRLSGPSGPSRQRRAGVPQHRRRSKQRRAEARRHRRRSRPRFPRRRCSRPKSVCTPAATTGRGTSLAPRAGRMRSARSLHDDCRDGRTNIFPGQISRFGVSSGCNKFVCKR